MQLNFYNPASFASKSIHLEEFRILKIYCHKFEWLFTTFFKPPLINNLYFIDLRDFTSLDIVRSFSIWSNRGRTTAVDAFGSIYISSFINTFIDITETREDTEKKKLVILSKYFPSSFMLSIFKTYLTPLEAALALALALAFALADPEAPEFVPPRLPPWPSPPLTPHPLVHPPPELSPPPYPPLPPKPPALFPAEASAFELALAPPKPPLPPILLYSLGYPRSCDTPGANPGSTWYPDVPWWPNKFFNFR